MRPRDNPEALAAFTAKKAENDAMHDRIARLSLP